MSQFQFLNFHKNYYFAGTDHFYLHWSANNFREAYGNWFWIFMTQSICKALKFQQLAFANNDCEPAVALTNVLGSETYQ